MSSWKNRIIGLEFVDPKKLIANPKNYKSHPESQVEMMGGVFQEVGWIQGVVVNKNTGNIIDGHMRVAMAVEKKEDSVPVIYVDLTDEEEDKALATYDPIGVFAKEEKEKMRDLFVSLNVQTDSMIDLLNKTAKKNKVSLDPNTGNDNTSNETKEEKREQERKEREALVEKWGVETGKIWRIPSRTIEGGYHRIMCGDSASDSDVDALVGKHKAFLMVTDPPYGISFETKFNPRSKDWDAIMGDEKKGEDLRSWLGKLLYDWSLHMYDESAWYIWSAVFEEGFAMYHAIHDAKLHVQSQIVWSKNAFSLGQTDYHWQHEICWYAFKLGENHRWYGGRDQSTIWDVTKVPNQKYVHPMQKPLELYSRPMKNHTKAGDVCFDPFLGSGTQVEAAENSSRICFGMENDPVWVATSLERSFNIGLDPEEVDE